MINFGQRNNNNDYTTMPTSQLKSQVMNPPSKPFSESFARDEAQRKAQFLNDPTYDSEGVHLYNDAHGNTIHTNPEEADRLFGKDPIAKNKLQQEQYNKDIENYNNWKKNNKGLLDEINRRDKARAELKDVINKYGLADRKTNAAKKYYNDNIYKKNVDMLKNGDFDDQVLYEKYYRPDYSGRYDDPDEALEQMKKDGLKVSKKDRGDFLKEHNLDNSFQQIIYDRNNNNDDEYDPELLRLLDMNEEDYLTDEERPEYEKLQQQLKDIDKEDLIQEAEDIIEKEPEAADILPDNNPLKKEAEQITDDNDSRNDEVNNEKAEEGLDDFWTKFKEQSQPTEPQPSEPQQQSYEIPDSLFEDFVKQMKAAEETPIDEEPLEEEQSNDDELSDDFFENYAAQLKEEQPSEEEPIAQEQPKQKAININDVINGTTSYEDFRKEGQRLLQQAEEHRKQARQKMIQLTDRKSEEGTPWGDRTSAEKGYIGSIGLKSGREFSKARFINGLTGAIDQLDLSEEERLNVLSDKKLMAQIRLLEKPKRRNKVTPEEYQNQIADLIANRNNVNEATIVQSVAEQLDLPQELVQNAPVEDIIEESEFVEDLVSNKQSLIDWSKVKVYEPNEDPYLKVHDDYDPRVEENLNYDYPVGVGAPGVGGYKDDDFTDDDDFDEWYESADDTVVDYGLEDRNQYQERIDDATIDDNEEEAAAEELVEESTDDEQRERRNRIIEWAFHTPLSGATGSTASVTTDKVTVPKSAMPSSARASRVTGNIGTMAGGISHGGFSAAAPRKDYWSINSVRTKAPTPKAVVTDNQGNVTSVKGSANRAFSNGSMNSGSHGLMSNKKSGGWNVAKQQLPGHTGHTSSLMVDSSNGGQQQQTTLSGRDALLRYLIRLVDELTPEERKSLGFSPNRYDYQHQPLKKLDGYTIQKLIEQIEDYRSNNNEEQ